MSYVVSKADVERASSRVYRHGVEVTPCRCLSRTLGISERVELFFKLESFQRSGSFKLRGATNAVFDIVQKQPENKELVVVTVSSGNFAQATALAASRFGLKSIIVMPNNTSRVKVNAVQDSYKAEISYCDPSDRDGHCARVVQELGPARARFVHPSEDPRVIAGNGTLMLELIAQVHDLTQSQLDIVVCPIGGGGVCSGVAAVCKEHGILVIGAEPALADDAYRSKQTNRIQGHRDGQVPKTVAEGLRTTLGPNTFPCIRDWVEEIILVEEREILESMKLIMERGKVVVEASASVAYAAVRSNRFREITQSRFPDQRIKVGVILSGGNVDLEHLPFLHNASY